MGLSGLSGGRFQEARHDESHFSCSPPQRLPSFRPSRLKRALVLLEGWVMEGNKVRGGGFERESLPPTPTSPWFPFLDGAWQWGGSVNFPRRCSSGATGLRLGAVKSCNLVQWVGPTTLPTPPAPPLGPAPSMELPRPCGLMLARAPTMDTSLSDKTEVFRVYPHRCIFVSCSP